MKHIKDSDAIIKQFGYDVYENTDSRYAALSGCLSAKLEVIGQEIERLWEKKDLTIHDMCRAITNIEIAVEDIMEDEND